MAFLPRRYDDLSTDLGDIARAARILDDPIAYAWAQIWDDAPAECRWTVEEVDSRLVDAIRLVARAAGRVGPGEMKGFWPALQPEWGDLLAQVDGGADFREELNAKIGPSARDITRMEQAIRWPTLYLGAHDGPRSVLKLWLRCKAHRKPFRRACQLVGWSERTAQRRRWHAALLIATGLMRDRVNVQGRD